MPIQNNNQQDRPCDHCGETLAAEGRFLEKRILCDDCYIEKIISPKAHKTYYPQDPFGYMRRLKKNEPIHPQKLH